MIFDELIVHDFGLYAGRQKIHLTPPTRDKPIILFGGFNGHGKTTLLDALQLCLYGPFAKTSNRRELSYHDYLSRCINRGSLSRESAIEVAFRHTVDGVEDCYRIYRSWRRVKTGCREHFEVIKNRRREDALAENWISYMEDLMPVNISNLFLFDGEQVESYAAQENSTQLISTAIHNLLGLDIVGQLDKDLIRFSRRKRTEGNKDPMHHEIDAEDSKLKDLQGNISDLRQEQAELKTTRIDPARNLLQAVESEYRELGGELYEKQVEIERELVCAEQALEESAARLREYAAGDLPMILVRNLLESILVQDQKEEKSRRSREILNILEVRDLEFIKMMESHEVDSNTIVDLSKFLDKDRRNHRKNGEHETIINLNSTVRNNLNLVLSHQIGQLIQSVSSELKENENLDFRLEQLKMKHASIPSEDTLSEIVNRRDVLITEIAALEKRYAEMGEEIDKLTWARERSEQFLLRMIESDFEAEGERQDRVRVLHHARRARSAINEFRKVIIARHVDKIGNLVQESYQQLLRKKSLITRLKIDPEFFSITLYGDDGHVLSSERLSAGERQLLAISLLWGLAKTSARVLPTAIDTPLGRLDAGHRKFLVERYFPFASHQVLLLSTDEEITGQNLEALQPFIGRSYVLCHDDTTGCTQILEGYFNQAEAA